MTWSLRPTGRFWAGTMAYDEAPGAGVLYRLDNKSWHVLQVEGAKSEETRQRRIAKSVDILGTAAPAEAAPLP